MTPTPFPGHVAAQRNRGRMLVPNGRKSFPMRVTIPKLQERARGGEKLAMLTCYDASFAAISDAAGVDILLIGDSLGMVIQGHDSMLPMTMDEMEYHTRLVARGSASALLPAYIPFGSFQEPREQA